MRFAYTLLLAIPLCAQAPQGTPPQGGRGGRGMEPPKNLKILKPEEVMPAMRTFTAGLGVRCDFCHVQDRASDELKNKVTAREMIAMTRQINTNFAGESDRVTCFTCHRGEAEPKSAPPAAAPGAAPAGAPQAPPPGN